jgi:hypothetical protein
MTDSGRVSSPDEAQEYREAAARVRAYLDASDHPQKDEQIAGYVTGKGRFMLTRSDLRTLVGRSDV